MNRDADRIISSYFRNISKTFGRDGDGRVYRACKGRKKLTK